MNLTACLRAANWRTLSAIARTQRLRLESPPSKARLVEALGLTLAHRVALEEFRAALPPAERRLLTSLATAGGRLPLANVGVTYGPLRPLTGTGADDPRRLARRPASPLETLVYRGLVFVVPGSDVMCRSLPQMPARATLMTASPGPGVGSGRSSMHRGWPTP